MRWSCLAFLASCGLVSASTGCNAILGNDDGFALPEDLGQADGAASMSPVMPAAGPSTQDEADGGDSPDDAGNAPTSTPDGSSVDASTIVDAGGSVQDASFDAGFDAGPCKDHEVRCGSTCVDLTSDSLHCGGCGTVCIPPTQCHDSKCKFN
jgi:hypothetical protein